MNFDNCWGTQRSSYLNRLTCHGQRLLDWLCYNYYLMEDCETDAQWGQAEMLEETKIYCRVKQGDGWHMPPQTPWRILAKHFQWQGEGGGKESCCEFFGVWILCSCSYPCRSGHNVLVNLQQMLFSVLQLLSLYEWTLQGQSPEKTLSCIFQAIGNVLLQKVQSQRD